MTKRTYRGALLLALGLVCAACDGRPPTEPTPPPSSPPSAPTVTAISPSTGSTVRPTPAMISGTGFLAGAIVTIAAVEVSTTVVDSTTITVHVPPNATGPADVVVINPGGLRGTLTGGFSYSFDEPFTVTPSTSAVDAGGQMSVSWTAPAGRAGDWIAVCRVGERYDDESYFETQGETSGTRPVTAPTRPGQYELRYMDGRFFELARSGPVTVR